MTGLFIAGAAKQMAATNHAQTTGQLAARTASEVRTQNDAIKFDVEKLFMITEALWECLKQQHGYTDESLINMIEEIDLRDGRLDGKVAKSADRPACKDCGRILIRRQARCLYCGAVAVQDPFKR